MPRIRRWFHVSHDINEDPEVWELTDTFGDWFLRVWLQMLSIGDRNNHWIKGERRWIESRMSRLWQSNSKRYNLEWRANRVRMAFDWMANKGWIRFDKEGIFIVNQSKYIRSRGDKQIPEGKQTASPPLLDAPTRSTPLRTRKTKKEEEGASPPALTPQDFLQAWNEICASEGLPQVTNLSNGRKTKIKARLKTYPDVAFWERVFNAIPQSDFLMGRKANPKHPHWKATIDWLIENDENPTKVAEGAYA